MSKAAKKKAGTRASSKARGKAARQFTEHEAQGGMTTKGERSRDKLKGLAGDLWKCAPEGHAQGGEWVYEMMKFFDVEKLRKTDIDYKTAYAQRQKLDSLSRACTKFLDAFNKNLDDRTSDLIHYSAYSIGYTDDLLDVDGRDKHFAPKILEQVQKLPDQVRKLRIAINDAKDFPEAKTKEGNSSTRNTETMRKDRVAWMFAGSYHAYFSKLPRQSADSAAVQALRLAFVYLGMEVEGAQRHLRNQVKKLRSIGKGIAKRATNRGAQIVS